MTDVEAYLATQKRYRCERLAANLTVEQCEQNRNRQRNLTADVWEVMSCQGCAGLGKAVQLASRCYSITLDFSEDAELYQTIQEKGITADDIIGLLYMLIDGDLRRAA